MVFPILDGKSNVTEIYGLEKQSATDATCGRSGLGAFLRKLLHHASVANELNEREKGNYPCAGCERWFIIPALRAHMVELADTLL